MKTVLICALGFLYCANGEKEIDGPSSERDTESRDRANPYELLLRIKRNPLCALDFVGPCMDTLSTDDHTPWLRTWAEQFDQLKHPDDNLRPNNRPRRRRSVDNSKCEDGKERVGCYICYCAIDKSYDICFPDGRCRSDGSLI